MKKLYVMITFLAILLIIAGCSNKEAVSQTEENNEEEKVEVKEEQTKVVMWHSMGGVNGETLDTLVSNFNDSQEDIVVEAIYQGDYAESFTKLKTSLKSDNIPTIMQSNFIRSGPMMDTNKVVPVQEMIDQDDYDTSSLDGNILSAYDMDGTLYSMPFNASTLLLYYNKDMFQENGLDPEQPPQTYEEIKAASEKLSDGDKYGASFGISSYFIEQLITVQGAELVNNGNGREGLANQSLLDSEEAINTYTWWKDLVDQEYMLNLGTANGDVHQAFLSGKVGMTLGSTAVLVKMIEGSEGKFEVGTGFIPYPEDKEGAGGVSVGGGSLYLMDKPSEEEVAAGWEFIKYVMEPEQQAYWHVNTGYFPVNNLAYEEQIVKDTLAEYPQFETAVNQLETALENNAGSNAGKGPVIGIYPDARTETQKAMEEVINDQKTPEQALTDAADNITNALERYNTSIE